MHNGREQDLSTQIVNGTAERTRGTVGHWWSNFHLGTATPVHGGAGLVGPLAHNLWCLSFQAGLFGTTGVQYKDCEALSTKEKAELEGMLDGLVM